MISYLTAFLPLFIPIGSASPVSRSKRFFDLGSELLAASQCSTWRPLHPASHRSVQIRDVLMPSPFREVRNPPLPSSHQNNSPLAIRHLRTRVVYFFVICMREDAKENVMRFIHAGCKYWHYHSNLLLRQPPNVSEHEHWSIIFPSPRGSGPQILQLTL